MKAKKLAYMAVLTALALVVFVIEIQIPAPAPLPGMKLGLANIITVYAVYRLGAGDAAVILFVRIMLGSLFSGNIMSLIFSLSGGFLCLLGMVILRRFISEKHIWLCSVFGAVLHNIGQTAVAVFVMKTTAVIAYLPFLTAAGCVAGLFTGIAAQQVLMRIDKRFIGNIEKN